MKIDWKSETTAALAAFALTGVAIWGSIIPIHTAPVMPTRQTAAISMAAIDGGMVHSLREGSYA